MHLVAKVQKVHAYMGHYSATSTLNGASTYDSSLMNPFAFTDAELLLHVTPGNGYPQQDGLQQQRASPGLHIPHPMSVLLAESNSGGLSALANMLDNGEATSVARPLPLPSEAVSRSTYCPGSPPRLASGTYGHGPFRSPGFSDTQQPELEQADSVAEDPADHREKNRVAQVCQSWAESDVLQTSH